MIAHGCLKTPRIQLKNCLVQGAQLFARVGHCLGAHSFAAEVFHLDQGLVNHGGLLLGAQAFHPSVQKIWVNECVLFAQRLHAPPPSQTSSHAPKIIQSIDAF